MKINILTLLIFTLFVMSSALTGCTSEPVSVTEIACAENDVSTSCILDNAEKTIAAIEGHYDWVTSAAELALALDSQGEGNQAWSYLEQAVKRLPNIADVKKRDGAAADLALTLKSMASSSAADPIISNLQSYGGAVEAAGKRADILCKIVTARAVHESPEKARKLALSLAQDSEIENSYRGRTQREIAAIFAKQGDVDSAISILEEITADFTYYKAVAQTDIMSQAAKAGNKDVLDTLRTGAEAIAEGQDNKYFSAGILRDIGHSYIVLGEDEVGANYIRKARLAAAQAPKFQEQSRSTSRIATRLADAGPLGDTLDILNDALKFLEQEESQMMTSFSLYEIAGSAAFSNNIEMSKKLVDELPDATFLSATSLRAAGQRDLAWGLVRHGNLNAGLSMANSITAPRERVHALSRIVRLINNPSMDALPRYL